MTLVFFIDKLNSSFEKKELENCIHYFEKVILITFDAKGLTIKNDKLSVIVIDQADYTTKKYFIKSFKFSSQFLIELVSCGNYFSNFSLYKRIISSFLRSIYLSDKINDVLRKNAYVGKDVILYSFWFNQWATALAVLNKQGLLSSEIISRTHGTDLFEERIPITKRIPFRSFQLKYIHKIFSVSKKGTGYLKKKYPLYQSKVFTSYLGTTSTGVENPFDSQEVFTIVSCAHVRNIKRIHLIPEILMNINFPVRWIHIGDENISSIDSTIPVYIKNKEKLKEKKNIEVSILGNLNNNEIIELYSKTLINLFISVSETEGLPVSMMEAISYGIPIMATDVGGCNEIVNEDTGILIPKDFDVREAAIKIENFKSSEKNSIQFRKQVRQYWKENFENESNFKQFVEMIQSDAVNY